MNPLTRISKYAKKQKGALKHLHVEGGRAYAASATTLMSTPADGLLPCGDDCEFPDVSQLYRQASDYKCLVDVTLTHLIRAVKLAAAIHSGRTSSDKRKSAGKRFVTLSANGQLDVSAHSDIGRTTTALVHGDSWNERFMKRTQKYRTSEVYYMKAGEDSDVLFEAGRLLEVLTLMKDTGSDRVELVFWNWHTGALKGLIARANGTEALLMGCYDPEES